jgi:proteasome lid subunit RPN8/RPN11
MARTETASFQMCLEVLRLDGTPAITIPLAEADFARAVETAFFIALRQGRFADYLVPRDGVRVEPLFGRKRSPSSAAVGFQVSMPTPDGGIHETHFSANFLRSHARRLVVDRVVGGELPPEDVAFRLAAYQDDAPAPASDTGMTLEPDDAPIPIRSVRRHDLGPVEAWDGPLADDFPVLIPRRVLHDALDQAREQPGQEVGGFLLGHLCRDEDSAELFMLVTCHIPAEGTEATGTSVTFTADTWAQARAVLEWRDEGEIFAGWAHSHPFRFCAECPDPPKPDCAGKVLFFSPEDHFLMELTFPQPFMVGLQTAVEPRLEKALGHLPVRLYGWRDGVIVPRGFEVIDGPDVSVQPWSKQ